MKKFTRGYMLILSMFVLIGIGMIIFANKDDGSLQPDASEIKKTPGLNTMLTVSEIITTQQLEKTLVNIEVKPSEDDFEDIILELKGNDFITEDTLLKDTYNILTNVQTVQSLHTITIIWYSDIFESNGEVLKVIFNREQIEKLLKAKYTEIPSIASTYEKNKQLN